MFRITGIAIAIAAGASGRAAGLQAISVSLEY